MTKRELMDELAETPDDAEIFVKFSEDHLERSVDGVIEHGRVSGPKGFPWVTLGLA